MIVARQKMAANPCPVHLSESITCADTTTSKSTIRTVWRDGDETTGPLTGNYYTFTGRRSDPESELMNTGLATISPSIVRQD